MIHQFYFIWIIKKKTNFKWRTIRSHLTCVTGQIWKWMLIFRYEDSFQCLALFLVLRVKSFFFLANINWSLWIRTFYSVFIIIVLLHFWIKCGDDWISQTRLNPPHFSVPISNIGTVLSISVCCLKYLVRWNGFGNFSDSVRFICTLLTWSQILELTLLRLMLIA